MRSSLHPHSAPEHWYTHASASVKPDNGREELSDIRTRNQSFIKKWKDIFESGRNRNFKGKKLRSEDEPAGPKKNRGKKKFAGLTEMSF